MRWLEGDFDLYNSKYFTEVLKAIIMVLLTSGYSFRLFYIQREPDSFRFLPFESEIFAQNMDLRLA